MTPTRSVPSDTAAGRPTVDDCRVYELPKIADPRGNLTFIEGNRHIPFDFRRVFYVYDLPTEQSRGAHAHKTLHQFIICISGSFDVVVDDAVATRRVHLNRPWKGLHVPPLIWAAEVNFDPGTAYLVLASELYDPADYIYDREAYLDVMLGRDRPR